MDICSSNLHVCSGITCQDQCQASITQTMTRPEQLCMQTDLERFEKIEVKGETQRKRTEGG